MESFTHYVNQSHYRPSVRIGNWYEDICLEEDEIRNFLKLRDNSQLLVQKTRNLFDNLYKSVEIEAASDTIRFGAVVQLLASQMKICDKMPNVKPALSVVINENVVRQTQMVNDRCEVTVAAAFKPVVRNTFVITSADDTDMSNETLKYGQNFRLQCTEAEEQPLLLFSAQKSPGLAPLVPASYECRDKGEINLPVGLCLKRNTGAGKLIPSAYTHWKCYHADPKLRYETEGTAVPTNVPIIITHSATNQNLAAENCLIQTLFGAECLVSVHTYLDVFKREKWQNIWTIHVGSEHKFTE